MAAEHVPDRFGEAAGEVEVEGGGQTLYHKTEYRERRDHFAFSQLHPWHLESACEWLERKGRLEKVSAPFKLTKRSQGQVEEPAYFLDVG